MKTSLITKDLALWRRKRKEKAIVTTKVAKSTKKKIEM